MIVQCTVMAMLNALLRASESGRIEAVKKLVEKHGDPFNIRFEGGRSLLHVAAERGHVDLVVFLCKEVRLSNALRDDYGNTPLHDAAHSGHLVIVSYLIEKMQSDPMSRGEGSCTALHTSSQGDQLEVVQYLINEHLIDPFVRDEDGDTPLHYAASHGRIGIVKFYYEQVKISVPCCNNEGCNPLHSAAISGSLDVVQYLVSFKFCDPKSESNNGCTPVHAACEGGCLETVKYLIECENEFQMTKDEAGKHPLHYAAQFGHLNVVRYLVEERMCDILCQTNSGNKPLHLAARNGHINVVTYLSITKECSPVIRGEIGWTALHGASEGGHIDIVKHLILEQNVSPLIEDEEGMTALHMAALHGHLELVTFLVEEKNCSIYHRNNDRNTPIHLAAANGHLDVIEYLIGTRKCDPTCRGQADYTALHAACCEGHLNIVKYLVGVGMDLSVQGTEGITAFDIAVTKGYHDITRFLRKTLNRARRSSENQTNDDSSNPRGQLLPFIKRKMHSTKTVLGRGMFGIVYELEMEGKVYAAKIFNSTNNEKMCRKLSSEVNILSNVHHPHVVQYYGLLYFDDQDLPALLMERLMTNLHNYILVEAKEDIELSRKFSLLCDVASGLSYLHARNPVIVHRDLTAKNVLLDTSLTAKIADFGNSRILDMDTDLTPESMTAQPGTLDYMPPEAFGENPSYSTELDMFSYGHLTIFVLTGTVHKLLPLRSTGHGGVRLRSEWERRSNSTASLNSILGENHSFVSIIQHCLSDDTNKRPSASIIRLRLIDLAGSERPLNKDEVLSATVTMQEVNVLKTPDGENISILHHLAPEWKRFGTLLRFDPRGQALDIISADHLSEGCVACCQEVLFLWLQGNGKRPASWAVLIQVIEDMQQMWLLKKVKSALKIV